MSIPFHGNLKRCSSQRQNLPHCLAVYPKPTSASRWLEPSCRHAHRIRAYSSTRYIPLPSVAAINPIQTKDHSRFCTAAAGQPDCFTGGLLRRRSRSELGVCESFDFLDSRHEQILRAYEPRKCQKPDTFTNSRESAERLSPQGTAAIRSDPPTG